MSDDEINIAIAEAIGWSQLENRNTMAMRGCWVGYPPAGAIISKKESVPYFCEDLNAMRRAEETLSLGAQRAVYSNLLDPFQANFVIDKNRVVQWDVVFYLIHSPARARAEAFLRTIGKWKDVTK